MHNLHQRLKLASSTVLITKLYLRLSYCGEIGKIFKVQSILKRKQPCRLIFISNRSDTYKNLLFLRVMYPDKTFLIYNKSTFLQNTLQGKKKETNFLELLPKSNQIMTFHEEIKVVCYYYPLF